MSRIRSFEVSGSYCHAIFMGISLNPTVDMKGGTKASEFLQSYPEFQGLVLIMILYDGSGKFQPAENN